MVSYSLFDRLTTAGRHCLRLRVVRAENSQMEQLGKGVGLFFLVVIPVKFVDRLRPKRLHPNEA